jgi:hypothetical protein
MNSNFYYVTIAKGYHTTYDYAEYCFSHISIKCNGDEIGSWDCNWAENFQLSIF